jgi:hypothetical protein
MAIAQSANSFERFGVVIAVGFLVFSLLGTFKIYQSYSMQFTPQNEVLGAKTESPNDVVAANSCLPQTKISEALKVGERTVTLYAPDKTLTLSLEPLVSCIVNTGCETSGTSCSNVKTTLDAACLDDYFKQYPLSLTTTVLLTQNDISVKVRKEDWAVNYKDLAAQLADAFSKEVSYCQLTGETRLPKKNIANLQLTVSDASASVEESFTKRFIEIDKSKMLLFFWNDGIYQPYYIKKGTRLPSQQIYLRKDIDIQKILQSIDAGYVLRNSESTDYVVVHE